MVFQCWCNDDVAMGTSPISKEMSAFPSLKNLALELRSIQSSHFSMIAPSVYFEDL